MAVIGTATLNVVPKISGLSETVRSEFAKVRAEALGEETGSKYTKGVNGSLVKSGVLVGAFAAITSKALGSISSHLGDATARFDTLNNYPLVMESLGYSSDAAESSISKMSDRLQTLPTTLDSMVSLTQGLVTTTGDLGKATDGALALNDMLLASGSSQQLVNSAQEQFRQILAKGKPEMQDWKSLTIAMPGQLDQLAKSMLGPTANANDLYAALGGGKNEQIISMDQLLDEIIRLDKEGGKGFASFQEQAEIASGGVATSAANMGNAVTRGITGVMDAVGKENIAGAFNDMKGGINSFFGAVQDGTKVAMPAVKGLWDILKDYGPVLLAGGAATTVFTGAMNKGASVVEGVSGRVKAYEKSAVSAGKAATAFGKATAAIGAPFNVASLAIGATAAVTMYCVSAWQKSAEEQRNMEKATTGLSDAVSRTASLDQYRGKIAGLGSDAKSSAMSLAELAESNAKHVDKMNEVAQRAEEQIGSLSSAQSIISQYAGQTDLSAQAQGQLEYALKTVNEQLGLNLTATDVMNGAYTDAEGNVQDLISSIDQLVEAKRREIQMEALSENLGEAYAARSDAAKTYAEAIKTHSGNLESINRNYESGALTLDEYNGAIAQNDALLEKAKKPYDEAAAAVANLEEEMGDATKAASEAADEYDKWGSTLGDVFTSLLQSSGASLGMLKGDMRSLGVDVTDLSNLSDEQLQQLAVAYDGTTTSIVGLLSEWGIHMDETATQAVEMASSIHSALEGMDLETVLGEQGIPLSDFSQKLADAGVSTEQLNAIGSENLAALASNCNGSIDAMIAAITGYNLVPILDKDGHVQVSYATLQDAQGNILRWNNDHLEDLDGNAIVDDRELVDAQGNLYTWNGSTLENKEADAEVDGNLKEANSLKSQWNNGDLLDKYATAYITIQQSGNAAGGIRWNAAGGIRYHADGAFIATRAMPLDIVGEAGAEAIVPLTNKRYSQPFVDLIADGVIEKGSQQLDEISYLVRQMVLLLQSIRSELPEGIDIMDLKRMGVGA